MELPEAVDKYRAGIDAELRSALAGYQSQMYDMLRYHLGWMDEKGNPLQGAGGKTLRPTLCLLACESVGGDPEKALPAAASIELLHNFSLIHDDVQDDDRERRHRPTVWSIWGKPQAINAGTAMRVVASLTLFRLLDRGMSVQKLLRAQRLLDESCLRLIEGQYLDISYEGRMDVTLGDYLAMIEGKTVSLIACSLEAGAFLGTDDDLVHVAFRGVGRDLGFAFQIRDDVLGIWGDVRKTGKPVGSDIRRRKKTFPIVYALEKADGSARAQMTYAFSGEVADDDRVDTVLGILEGVDARSQAQGMAEEYRDRALAGLERVPLSPWARHNLMEMAHFLTEREY